MIFCMFSCSVVRTRSCHTVIECLSKNIFLTNSVSSAFSVIYASVSLYFVNCLHLDLEKQIFPLSTSHQYAYWMKLRCKTQKKQPWEKSNYCRNFSETRCTRGVGGWGGFRSVVTNHEWPTKNEQQGMCWFAQRRSARTRRLLQGPNLWDSSMPPGLIHITS